MRFFRQFIADATCGSPLAAIIGMLMALQALIGGFGAGAMAQTPVDTAVICSIDGVVHQPDHAAAYGQHADHGGPDAPHTKHTKDCCLTACQVAASLHAGILAKAPQPAARSGDAPALLAPVVASVAAPRQLGLSRDARGPPSLTT